MFKMMIVSQPLRVVWKIDELKVIAPRHFKLLEVIDKFVMNKFNNKPDF